MSYYPPQGQYPPPPGPYPGPGSGSGYWQEPPKGKGLAITTLVLGILTIPAAFTIVGGYILGVFAIIFGLVALLKKNAGGKVMAIIGLILGLLGLIGSIIATIWLLNLGFKDYFDCVQDAGTDQAKISKCERDFRDTVENKLSVTPAPTR